jgi:hypothetical protein
MTNPIVRIHDIETNEIIDRKMTAEELTQYELDKITEAARLSELTNKAAAKAALLAKLGITEDEAALLLGGN